MKVCKARPFIFLHVVAGKDIIPRRSAIHIAYVVYLTVQNSKVSLDEARRVTQIVREARKFASFPLKRFLRKIQDREVILC